EKWSNSRGRPYYFNPNTGQSVWDKPSTFTASTDPSGAPTQVRASHLLVKHAQSRRPASWKSPNITRTPEEALELIKGFRERIEKGEVKFEELAKVESDCSSAAQGGDLGVFGRGKMQKAFEDGA
ncbi:hypothetical protein HDV05_006004, partial [Chytridiales sp. JEL 0842]